MITSNYTALKFSEEHPGVMKKTNKVKQLLNALRQEKMLLFAFGGLKLYFVVFSTREHFYTFSFKLQYDRFKLTDF